jgi:hypothetical protein
VVVFPEALRVAIDRLLADAELRRRLSSLGRERISALCGWDSAMDATVGRAFRDVPAA